jgi:hypothetical protein
MKILNPMRLNEAFSFAHKVELSIEGQHRRYKGIRHRQYKGISKTQPLLKYLPNKKKTITGSRESNPQPNTELPHYKGGQHGYN